MQSGRGEIPGGDAMGAGESVVTELEKLREREREMAELLGSRSPDRLLHDLRNLLNEVQLLRAVIEDSDRAPQ